MRPRKVVILGAEQCGKSCIVKRVKDNCFVTNGEIPTLGVNIVIDNEVHYWDLSGKEKYAPQLVPRYAQDASIILLVYSVANRESFMELEQRWFPLLRKSNIDLTKMHVCILATQSDVPDARRQVKLEEGVDYAASITDVRVSFFECSAVSGQGCDHIKTLVKSVPRQLLPPLLLPASSRDDAVLMMSDEPLYPSDEKEITPSIVLEPSVTKTRSYYTCISFMNCLPCCKSRKYSEIELQ